MSVFCCAEHVAVRFALMCCYVDNRIRGSHEVLYSFGFTATEHVYHFKHNVDRVSFFCDTEGKTMTTKRMTIKMTMI